MTQIVDTSPSLIYAQNGFTYALPIVQSVSTVVYDRVESINGLSGILNITSSSLTISASGSSIDFEINTSNPYTWTATQTFAGISVSGTAIIGLANLATATTTLSGTTAGSIIWDMPFQGSGYKKVVIFLNGYENDTTTAQTITYPTAFLNAPNIYNPQAVPGVTATTTTFSIAPDSATIYTGWIILEGF
jgi:hypothetical protein